jgi:hypothetical protein
MKQRRLARGQVRGSDDESPHHHEQDSHQHRRVGDVRDEKIEAPDPAEVIEDPHAGQGIDRVGEVGQREDEETPRDQHMKHARNESEAKDVLEEARLHDHADNSFGKERPVDLPLSAGNVLCNARQSTKGEISRGQRRNDEQELFKGSEHDCLR